MKTDIKQHESIWQWILYLIQSWHPALPVEAQAERRMLLQLLLAITAMGIPKVVLGASGGTKGTLVLDDFEVTQENVLWGLGTVNILGGATSTLHARLPTALVKGIVLEGTSPRKTLIKSIRIGPNTRPIAKSLISEGVRFLTRYGSWEQGKRLGLFPTLVEKIEEPTEDGQVENLVEIVIKNSGPNPILVVGMVVLDELRRRSWLLGSTGRPV